MEQVQLPLQLGMIEFKKNSEHGTFNAIMVKARDLHNCVENEVSNV